MGCKNGNSTTGEKQKEFLGWQWKEILKRYCAPVSIQGNKTRIEQLEFLQTWKLMETSKYVSILGEALDILIRIPSWFSDKYMEN